MTEGQGDGTACDDVEDRTDVAINEQSHEV
jgi:hypothetical protein